MSIIKSQNGKCVVFSQNINVVRTYKGTSPTFERRQCKLNEEYSHSVEVSYDWQHVIVMANYKTEQEAATVMNAIIDHIKKDEDYDIPMEVHFEEEK